MFNHYEINVSLNGRHFFATAPRSLRDRPEAWAALAIIESKFPRSEGYAVSMTYWEAVGHACTVIPDSWKSE